MDQDLKRENNRNVFLIMATALACSASVQLDITSVSLLADLAVLGGGSLLLSVVLVMISNLLPHNLKHKLVFMRIKNELPACRIHLLCRKEPRIEFDAVTSRWPDVFSSDINEESRNSRWYQQIYKTVKDKAEVRQAHRTFLLYRDTTAGLFIIFLVTLGCILIGEVPWIGKIKPTVIFIQFIFLILALIAANIAGKRMVVNAVVAAE